MRTRPCVSHLQWQVARVGTQKREGRRERTDMAPESPPLSPLAFPTLLLCAPFMCIMRRPYVTSPLCRSAWHQLSPKAFVLSHRTPSFWDTASIIWGPFPSALSHRRLLHLRFAWPFLSPGHSLPNHGDPHLPQPQPQLLLRLPSPRECLGTTVASIAVAMGA